MKKELLKDIIGWGVALWAFGYLLGMLLYPIIPTPIIGWVIMPIGIFVTLFILLKKVHEDSLQDYFAIAVGWTLLAITFDYLFLVKIYSAPEEYYKFDVYLYYTLTFILPFVAFWYKKATSNVTKENSLDTHDTQKQI